MHSQPLTAIFRMLLAAAGIAGPAHGEGHGPAFGLATPTLARGQWSSDTAMVRIVTQSDDAIVFREMLGYGITEDLQALLTFPLDRSDEAMLAQTRGGSMMGNMNEVEASLLWRFHRDATAIGTRRESALLVGISEPVDDRRGDLQAGNGIHVAAVTGYASRTVYWWVGAGTQYRFKESGDQLGTLYYLSSVFGWRPPVFQRDYPKPDWRLFLEGVAERTERHRMNGQTMPDSGGEKMLVGPSVLGLYGRWGVEAGVLWPVAQSQNGSQPEEHYRAKFVFTYWF
jgi:hypothetical protein